jgi:hypothetical protein
MPTAVQLVIEVHETPLRDPFTVPDGRGIVRSDHRPPCQIAEMSRDPAVPTEMQLRLRHETLFSVTPPGAVWIDHLEPFQRATVLASPPPTARHILPDAHDTATRAPATRGLAVTFGVRSRTHVDCSSRSAKVSCLPAASVNPPTATHPPLEKQETPLKWGLSAPAGGGAVWVDQFVPSHG